MGKRTNNKVGGGAFTIFGVIWLAYDRYTTVKDLPNDATDLVKLLADPPWYLPWVVVVFAVIILAWAFWDNGDPDTGSDVTQSPSTSGPNSTAVAVMGDYHHYSAPAATQPRKEPYLPPPSPRLNMYNDRALEGLARVMGTPPPSHPLGLARYIKAEPKPDVALNALLGRVYKKCGPVPEDGRLKANYYKRVDREIQDAVVLNKLSTWGYYMDTAIRPIGCHVWQNALLNHRKKTLSIPTDSARPMIMKDLRFDKEETDAIWPSK